MTTYEEEELLEGPAFLRLPSPQPGGANPGVWTDDIPSEFKAAAARRLNPLMDLGTYSPPQAPAAGSSPGQERSRSAGSPGSPGPETPSSKPQVSEADTPEALADVELTSVAPSQEWFKNKDDILTLSYAVVIGVVVAASVFTFDVSIQFIHDLPDIFAVNLGIGGGRATGFQLGDVAIPFRCIMPVGAGVLVAWLQSEGFSPPLKMLTRAIEGVVDDRKSYDVPRSYWPVFRKAAASAITLGSGASLGPEAPSVELGANTAAVLFPKELSKRRQRMLVAAGAAAGVTAAFDAPVAGALFAIEFVLKSSRLGLDRLSTSTVFVATSVAAGVEGFLRSQGQVLGLKGAASHLVGRIPYFSLNNNLIFDVLQFSALGVGCAGAAVLLYEGVRVSEVALRPLPRIISAPLAGAMCGAIALKFPAVQYGYIALEEIFRDSTRMSTGSLFGLLLAKIAATSVCVGGGLVGGLFAPSLFLGALVGDIMGQLVGGGSVVDTTSYVVVGAAAVLGAACRAPLTAMALMVEITRDTGLLVPLLAAIGMSSLVTDYLEVAFSKQVETFLVGAYLRSKMMFWGAAQEEAKLGAWPTPSDGPPSLQDSVASVMATSTNMYVRHTLPLEQARTAMADKRIKAAVVVDDNFKVMGVVYLPDVEDEIVRKRELNARDSNFNRPS
ncbi:chloride channel [Haematococcus lacustris]